MASAVFTPNFAGFYGTQIVPGTRGPMTLNHGVVLALGRLPTDSIGTFNLTLTNVVVGSRVHVEIVSTGAAVHDSVAGATTVVISLPAYTPGSASNELKVKVRKASESPFYRPYSSQVTALVGAAGIYIEQQLDE